MTWLREALEVRWTDHRGDPMRPGIEAFGIDYDELADVGTERLYDRHERWTERVEREGEQWDGFPGALWMDGFMAGLVAAEANPTRLERVAIKLYRNNGASGVPWAELDEWKKQAWRAEAEDVLS